MGPRVKFLLAIIDSIFNQQNGGYFFSCKVGHEGGGGVRGLRVTGHKKYINSFLNISLRTPTLKHRLYLIENSIFWTARMWRCQKKKKQAFPVSLSTIWACRRGVTKCRWNWYIFKFPPVSLWQVTQQSLLVWETRLEKTLILMKEVRVQQQKFTYYRMAR